jgi:hypothetical protein
MKVTSAGIDWARKRKKKMKILTKNMMAKELLKKMILNPEQILTPHTARTLALPRMTHSSSRSKKLVN